MKFQALRSFFRTRHLPGMSTGGWAEWSADRELAKAVAFREASRDIHGGQPNLSWIVARVTKTGGGSPSKSALHQFFAIFDADGDWFPGKHCGKTRGPEPLLTREKRRRIAESAMTAKKKRRVEPCVAACVVACPEATRTPETCKPFSGKSAG